MKRTSAALISTHAVSPLSISGTLRLQLSWADGWTRPAGSRARGRAPRRRAVPRAGRPTAARGGSDDAADRRGPPRGPPAPPRPVPHDGGAVGRARTRPEATGDRLGRGRRRRTVTERARTPRADEPHERRPRRGCRRDRRLPAPGRSGV